MSNDKEYDPLKGRPWPLAEHFGYLKKDKIWKLLEKDLSYQDLRQALIDLLQKKN